MQKPTLDIDIKLVVETPNNIVITDNTDYTALGLDSSLVTMTVQIYTPIGLLYSPSYFNTPETEHDGEYSTIDIPPGTDAGIRIITRSNQWILEGEPGTEIHMPELV